MYLCVSFHYLDLIFFCSEVISILSDVFPNHSKEMVTITVQSLAHMYQNKEILLQHCMDHMLASGDQSTSSSSVGDPVTIPR